MAAEGGRKESDLSWVWVPKSAGGRNLYTSPSRMIIVSKYFILSPANVCHLACRPKECKCKAFKNLTLGKSGGKPSPSAWLCQSGTVAAARPALRTPGPVSLGGQGPAAARAALHLLGTSQGRTRRGPLLVANFLRPRGMARRTRLGTCVLLLNLGGFFSCYCLQSFLAVEKKLRI